MTNLDESVLCSRWAAQPSTAPRSCSRRATRFFVRDGVPDAFCQTCYDAWLGGPFRHEISREEYLRLTAVAEVMGS